MSAIETNIGASNRNSLHVLNITKRKHYICTYIKVLNVYYANM